ncbi:MAG: hypothetical protein R3E42_09180 [Burkholderiaceae bacterium]
MLLEAAVLDADQMLTQRFLNAVVAELGICLGMCFSGWPGFVACRLQAACLNKQRCAP